MQVDYIVVGLGLGGIALCEQLQHRSKSFLVFDHGHTGASVVASGLYNPIVLKRFVPAWKGHELMQYALPQYQALEQKLKTTFLHPAPIWRKFASVSEVNDWQQACDSPSMAPYLDPEVLPNNSKAIDAPFGYGQLKGTGWADCALLLSSYRSMLLKKNCLREEPFSYNQLDTDGDQLVYKEIIANKILFSEGTGMIHNPWFSYIPLRPTKGELLVIQSPGLNQKSILHSGVFIIPLGGDLYKVGATYSNNDNTLSPTKEGRTWIEDRFKKIVRTPFKVVDHLVGIRPTTPDRRPVVGIHPNDKRMAVLNGLGSRGVLLSPFVAKSLMDHLEDNKPLLAELDTQRYAC